jgi:ABC-type multidrug transport system ATPase subunit
VSAADRRPAPAGAVLACHGLRKSLGARLVVDDVGFEVRRGEAYGLLGPHGSGKSAVLRMVCGLLRPDAGVARARGRRVDALSAREAAEAVGYVPQCVAALPSLTVVDNVRFWARLHGVPDGRRHERAAEALARAGLDAHAADAVADCPVGVQRRLGLAVALLHRPHAVVLDVPTAGIDARNRGLLLGTLARLRDEGVAVLLASRDPREVARLCDRVGLIDGGRLVEEGRPADLLRCMAEPAPA